MSHSIFVIDRNKVFYGLIYLLWIYEGLFRYISVALWRIPFVGDFLRFYLGITCIILLLVLSIKDIFSNINYRDIIFAAIVFLVSIVTLLVGAKTTEAFGDLAPVFLFNSFPMYFIGKVVTKKTIIDADNKLIINLTTLSMISAVVMVVIGLRTGISVDAEWMSDQYAPYLILPHLLLIIASIFKKFNPVKLFVLVVGVLYVLMLGNRGSVICLLTMFLIMLIYQTSTMRLSRRLLILVIFSVVIGIMAFTNLYRQLLLGLYAYAQSKGLSTRVFLFFLGDDSSINFDSGRSDILKMLWNKVVENPFGYGLASDRYLGNGLYAHNVFLEIVVDFGLFIGGVIVIVLMYNIIRAIIRSKHCWSVRTILYVLLCCGFVKLFISGSYLTEPYFFALIGTIVAINQYYKNIIKEE